MARIITKSGRAILEKKLKELLVRREVVLQELEDARKEGDLKENAEYHAAKEEQGLIQHQIGEIEIELKESKLEDKTVAVKGEISLGSSVDIEKWNKEKMTITLVSVVEVNPMKGNISVESPLGMAIMGQKTGAKVMVKPDIMGVEEREYKILNVH